MGSQIWRIGEQDVALDAGVLVGVLNVTPDSFSDGGDFLDVSEAVSHGLELARSGAQIVDVGGESTRPGSQRVDAEEEIRRVVPVVVQLVEHGLTVSIDTTKSEVAQAAIEAGASVVNDISAGSDPKMLPTVAERGAGIVLMHMQGTPRTMQHEPTYEDVVSAVIQFLDDRVSRALSAGIAAQSIVVDPGIGFGKTVRHNLLLLRDLERLGSLGYPVMLGTSRKSFLGHISGIKHPADRDPLTAATTAMGFISGARVFRVHNVAASRDALALAAAIVTDQ